MAKKKENGNLGLIITLVFFVLSTVILGVTTYMGFSGLDEKEKAKKDAEDKLRVAETSRNWNRFQAQYGRAVVNGTASDAADLARDLQQFNSNSLSAAQGQKDAEEVRKFVAATTQRTNWDPTKAAVPSTTLDSLLRNRELEIEGLRNEVRKAREAVARLERERAEDTQKFEKDLAAAKLALEENKKKALEDRRKDLDDINARTAQLGKENEVSGDLRKRNDEMTKELDKTSAQLRKLQGQVATMTRENRELKEQLDDKRNQLAALLEKTGQEARTVESQVQDARAMQALKEWKHDWRIVQMDRRGSMPYINLGTADNVTPQLTFSIHAAGADGKLNPIAKGTAEVVRTVGPHMSQVRVTSVKEASKDPILPGDRLFNPTWDPSKTRHVAIAGLADLMGDNTDTTDELRRLLRRQNVEIDAYIDVKDEKGPRIVGKGVTQDTDYLILGDGLDAVGNPKARDKDFGPKFEKLRRDLKDKAADNGVTVISLKKYLELIGYRTPRAGANGQGANR
jgi:hypothetical protein